MDMINLTSKPYVCLTAFHFQDIRDPLLPLPPTINFFFPHIFWWRLLRLGFRGSNVEKWVRKKTKNRGRNKYTAQVEYLCEGCNNIPWTMSKTSLWIHKKIESIPSVSFIRVGWGSFILPYIPSMLIDVYIYSVIKILTPICKTCLDCSMKAPLTWLIFYIPAVCIALRFKCSAPSNAIPITRNMYSVI